MITRTHMIKKVYWLIYKLLVKMNLKKEGKANLLYIFLHSKEFQIT